MYLKVKGTVVAMNPSRFLKKRYDLLLDVQEVDAPSKVKEAMLCKRIVFEGIYCDEPFFVGDEISFFYREDLGPRRFKAKVLSSHQLFVNMTSMLGTENPLNVF